MSWNEIALSLILFIAGFTVGFIVIAGVWRRKVLDSENLVRHQVREELQVEITRLRMLEANQNQEILTVKEQYQQSLKQERGLLAELGSLRESAGKIQTQYAIARERLLAQSELQASLAEKDHLVTALRTENTELKTRLEHETRHFDEQIKLLSDAKIQLSKEFENIAHKIFESKQQQFTQSSKRTLEATLDPVKEQLKAFHQKVEDVYDKENAERNKLIGQINELQKQTLRIGDDAINLAKALKGDNKAQGNWGEVILERILEQSGLQKGREFETQVALNSEEGQRRNPDVIVRLPENKDIIIDAKVSLLDYERYCCTDDDEERQHALKQHIASLRLHVSNLSLKNYANLEQVRTLDFVFIFVPIEAAFMLALQHEPNLFREAYDKNIILVSPTTLLATLRTVEGIWRYEKQNKNAEKIANQAGGLYDQFVLLMNALEDVERNLNKTQEAYCAAKKRLVGGRGNLVKRVEDIKQLGAKTKKALSADLLAEAEQSVTFIQ